MFGLFERKKEAVQQQRVDDSCKKRRDELNDVFEMANETTTDLNKLIDELKKTGTHNR